MSAGFDGCLTGFVGFLKEGLKALVVESSCEALLAFAHDQATVEVADVDGKVAVGVGAVVLFAGVHVDELTEEQWGYRRGGVEDW